MRASSEYRAHIDTVGQELLWAAPLGQLALMLVARTGVHHGSHTLDLTLSFPECIIRNACPPDETAGYHRDVVEVPPIERLKPRTAIAPLSVGSGEQLRSDLIAKQSARSG